MTKKRKVLMLISLCLTGVVMLTACKVSGSDASETTDASIIAAESSVSEPTKEPTETAAATTAKATQKVTATTTPTVKETTAATTTKASETTAPAATTKATAAPAATTKATAATTAAPAATTKATTAATTAAPPVETAPPVATTAAYTPNCDNISSLIVSNLQSRGYWFPDAASVGGGSVEVTTGYFSNDEGFANNIINGKFANLDKLGIGVVSVNVWIENGYVNFSYVKCAYPTA